MKLLARLEPNRETTIFAVLPSVFEGKISLTQIIGYKGRTPKKILDVVAEDYF